MACIKEWMISLKYRILLLLVIFALAYLYAQYRIFEDVSNDEDGISVMKSLESPKHSPRQSYLNIRDFVNICASHGVDVILLEPVIMRRILHTQRSNGSKPACRFLCTEETLTTFAVLENSWHHSVLDELKIFGYDWVEIRHPDPRLFSLESTLNDEISVHFLFWRISHMVHLVVLYERTGPFLWFSSIRFHSYQRRWLQNIKFDASRLQFGQFDGALSIIEVAHVTIDKVSLIAPKFPAKLLKQIETSHFIECNYKRAEQFHSVYSRDISDAATVFRQRARKLLKIARNVLNAMDIPFWLSSGTCLGWFRQCDIIPYSLDVDIGIHVENYHHDIIQNMEHAGLHFHYKFGKLTDSLQLAFILDQVKLDVYFFYTDGPFMWNGGTHARSGNKFKYLFPRFALCWTSFMDMLLRIPCDTEAYVEANYGENWLTPVTKWSWKESPPNIRDNGQWPREEWDDVIQIFE